MKRAIASALALFCLCVVRPASAAERLAVLISVEQDARLAENLTEIAIAKLSQSAGRELVGLSELASRLLKNEVFAQKGGLACVEDPRCLAEIGDAAAAGEAVVGRVRRTEHGFALEFVRLDTRTGARHAQVSETTTAEIAALIAGVESAVSRLFEVEARPTPAATPRSSTTTNPELVAPIPAIVPQTPPARDATPRPRARADAAPPPAPGPRTKTLVAYSLAGAAVVAVSAAIITGVIAGGTPVGSTRQAAQADLERRKDFATASNVLLIGGATLGVGALVTYAWP